MVPGARPVGMSPTEGEVGFYEEGWGSTMEGWSYMMESEVFMMEGWSFER